MLGRFYNGHQEKYGYKALRIERHIVRQTLLQELENEGIEVTYGAKCVDIVEHGEDKDEQGLGGEARVTVRFADGHVERGDFVIGADGIHSRLRKYIDPTGKCEPIFSGQMGLGGSLRRAKLYGGAKGRQESDLPYMPCLMMGKDNAFALMPCSYDGNNIGFFATVEEKERSRDEWAKLDADKEQLSQILRERHNCAQDQNKDHESSGWPEIVRDICRDAAPSSLLTWP